MYRNKKILAIIGSRSGSKSVKDKNLIKINGKPLLYWIIKKALKSKYLDKIYVSTDSKKYQKLAIKFGALCPELRPKYLSKDQSKEIDYVLHTIQYLKKNKIFKPDYVVRLQPTSPFQSSSDIDQSIKKIVNDQKATSLQVVSESTQPPFKALKLYNKKYLKPYYSSSKNNNVINRQKLNKAYYRSNIIISKIDFLLKKKCQIGHQSLIYEIPMIRSIDINNLHDIEIAKAINSLYKFLK